HIVDRVGPAGIVVASEVERLPRGDLTRRDVVNLIGQRQDQTAHSVDPRHPYLIRSELPPQIKIATVAVVEIEIPGLELVDGLLRGAAVDHPIKTSARKALA